MNRLKLALLIGVLIKPLRSFFFTFVRPPRNLKSLQKIRPIALVFGASSGIGNQFCYSLSKRNFHIIAVARREQNLQELQRQLGPKNCTIFPQDVTQASVLNVFETFDLSKLGIVVNCAGITQKLPSEINQIQSDEIDRIIGINVVAATRIYQRSCQVLTNNNGGIIINLASGVGICPCPLLSVYSASKAYCQALVEATRPELSKNGVLALSGTPFWVATEMTETTRTSFRMAGASQWVERFLAADWNGNHVNCWFSHQLFEFGIRVLGRFSGIVQLNQMEIIKKNYRKKIKDRQRLKNYSEEKYITNFVILVRHREGLTALTPYFLVLCEEDQQQLVQQGKKNNIHDLVNPDCLNYSILQKILNKKSVQQQVKLPILQTQKRASYKKFILNAIGIRILS